MSLMHKNFTDSILNWAKQHGRSDLPWQNPRSAYRVWISEIMLQQTSVKTVIPYFTRFMERFGDLNTLATADLDDVLALWSGLGYYHRAHHILQTARIILQQGKFPHTLEELQKLPGIGPSTAAAIASLAFDLPTAILDGNVKRVLSRYFLIDGMVTTSVVQKKLWSYAQACMPKENCAAYTQAIMDFGATFCTRQKPACIQCPLNKECQAYLKNVVSDYPTKKPKRILPIKEQQFLVLYRQPLEIYLEKNPPTGLWAGLWCLPQIDLNQNAMQYTHDTYHLQADHCQKVTYFRHTFSHFHLDLQALSIHTTPMAQQVCEAKGQWFSPQTWDKLGLSTPIRQILDVFLANQTCFTAY